VAREAGEPVGQQVQLDALERGDALRVPVEAAVAVGNRLAFLEQSLHGDVDVAQLPGHARGALHDVAALDDPAAQAGAHDHGDRRVARGVRAEEDVVGVEGGRVPIIVIDDRDTQPGLDGAAEVEPVPAAVGEVRGSARGDDTLRAGGAGAVQADGADPLAAHARVLEDQVELLGDGLDGHLGAFLHAAGQLDEPVHQEALRGIQDRRVVGAAPVVEADDDPVPLHQLSRARLYQRVPHDCRLARIGAPPCAVCGSRDG
jgi:hypothetical protein